MDKNILEQYEYLKKEYADTVSRIRQTEKELQKYDSKYQVCDSVRGGDGGNQHFKIQGFPYPEYTRKKTLLQKRKLRLEILKDKLDIMLDEVEQYIDSVDDSRKRLILKYRYIDGMKWKDIAKKLGPGNNAESIRIEIYRFTKNSVDI